MADGAKVDGEPLPPPLPPAAARPCGPAGGRAHGGRRSDDTGPSRGGCRDDAAAHQRAAGDLAVADAIARAGVAAAGHVDQRWRRQRLIVTLDDREFLALLVLLEVLVALQRETLAHLLQRIDL